MEAFQLSFHKWGSRGPTSQHSSRNAYGWSPQELKSQTRVITHLWNQLIPTKMASNHVMYIPMYPRVPTLPWTSFPSISLTARPRSEMRMWPFRNKSKSPTTTTTAFRLLSHRADSFVMLSFVTAGTAFFHVMTFPSALHVSEPFIFKLRGTGRRHWRGYIVSKLPEVIISVSYLPLLCFLVFPKYLPYYFLVSITVLITWNSCQVNHLCYFLG